MSDTNAPVKRTFPASRYFFDFILCLLMSLSLFFVLCGGFHVAPQLQYNIFALVLLPAVYLAVMFFGTRSRLATGVAIGVVVLGTIVAIAALTAATGQPQPLADTESNPCVFVLLGAAVTAFVFLLARTFRGSIFLFVLGSLCAGVIQFLYNWNYVLMTVAFIAMAVCTVVFKYYQRAYLLADAKDAPHYGAAFLAGLITSVIVVGVGACLWFGIEAALHPQALQLKPFKEYFAYEVVDITGVADSTQVDNDQRTSSNVSQDSTFTGSNNKDDSSNNNDNNDQEQAGLPTEGSMVSYTQDSMEEAFNVISYNIDSWQYSLIAILVLLLIFVPILVRKLLRWRWHKAVLEKPGNQQVADFYLFFLSRFDCIGLGKPKSVTALSFGEHSDAGVSNFEAAAGVSFAELSQVYTSCVYGGKAPTEDAVEKFQKFYQSFYKCCVRHVGRIKYIYKFFRL